LALNKNEEPLNPHVNGTITTRTGRSQSSPEEVVIHPFREADLHNYKETDVAGTLKASGGVLAGGSETFAIVENIKGAPLFIPEFYESHGQDSRYNEVNVCPTISASFGMGGGHIPLTHNVPIAIAENIIGRQPENGGNGEGWAKDTMYTLNATGVHGVAVDTYNGSIQGDVACTLTSASGISNASGPKAMVAQSFNVNARPDEMKFENELSGTLTSSQRSGFIKEMSVRRLTPKECERLQGFSDEYTNIPGAADTGRYKALGNSMAVPVMRWIGERINEVENGSKAD
jgi:DNA (cytosine-5)-methyltransferase 1